MGETCVVGIEGSRTDSSGDFGADGGGGNGVEAALGISKQIRWEVLKAVYMILCM